MEEFIRGIKDTDTNELLKKLLLINERILQETGGINVENLDVHYVKKFESLFFMVGVATSGANIYTELGKLNAPFGFHMTEIEILTYYIVSPPDLMFVFKINGIDYPTVYMADAQGDFNRTTFTYGGGFFPSAIGGNVRKYHMGLELQKDWTLEIRAQNTRGETVFVFIIINGWRFD